MNSCEEIIEKYLLNENPLYTFSFPISLLCGIIMFGIMQAYNVSKNSYINQLLIPIATIFIVMVLIDVISKNMIPYNIKKTLYNNCMDITNYMSDDNKMNKIQIEGGKRKTKKRTKKLYKRSKRKYKKCNSRI